MVNDCMVEDWKETSGNGSQQMTRQGEGNKLKNLHKTKAKGSNGLGVKAQKNLKGSRNLKRPIFSFGSKDDLSQPLEGQRGSEQVENGRDVKHSNPSAKNQLGYLVQEKSGGDSRQGYSTNSCNTDRDSGLVQGRAGTSMEATIPHNSNEHQNWGSAVGPQCVESHAQLVVEIPHGHSDDFLGSSRGVEQAETTISYALLGRIQMVNPGK